MTEKPSIINMKYTSFAPEEPYKPPSGAFFGAGNAQKKQKYIPGGEWAQDEKPTTPPQKAQFLDEVPMEALKPVEEKPKKSKYKFIEKKTEQPKKEEPIIEAQINSMGLLEFSEIRTDR